jgi:hypothetical protein
MVKTETSKVILASFFMLVLACLLLYVYLFQIDRKYNSLIIKEMGNFQTLQEFTSESNKNFFLLYDVIYPEKSGNPVEIEKQWKENSDRNSDRIDAMTRKTLVNPVDDPYYKNMISARKQYIKMTGELFTLISSGQKDSISIFFYSRVKPGFGLYQNLLEKFVEQHKVQLIQYSLNISDSAKKTSLSILFLGFSPFLIISLVLLIVAVILTVLFLSLKGIDMTH